MRNLYLWKAGRLDENSPSNGVYATYSRWHPTLGELAIWEKGIIWQPNRWDRFLQELGTWGFGCQCSGPCYGHNKENRFSETVFAIPLRILYWLLGGPGMV
jgi:hypothetical protein